MGLLIRFKRVQVQLRSHDENTIKILNSIRRVNFLEKVYVFILVVANVCNAIGLYGSEEFEISKIAAEVWYIIGNTFEIAFVFILCISMHDVNKQLALFFD